MAVTNDNFLVRLDNLTGEVLEEIYLGPKNKYLFRHVDWETQGETILLQTILFPNKGENKKEVVQVMAVFEVYPLKFLGMFEVEKQVSIFNA